MFLSAYSHPTLTHDAEMSAQIASELPSDCRFVDGDVTGLSNGTTDVILHVSCDRAFEIIFVNGVSGYPLGGYVYHSDVPVNDLELSFNVPSERLKVNELKMVPVE